MTLSLSKGQGKPFDSADAKRLLAIVDRFHSCSVLVLGDVLADEYVYGRVARVSREAPVLILEYHSTEVVPGGAGNAASNVAALGGTAGLVGIVGRDEPGRRLLQALPRRVERAGVLRPPRFQTPIKTRILAGGVHSAKQQVVRIDRRGRDEVNRADRAKVEAAARKLAAKADAILVSDYGSGLVRPAFVTELARLGRQKGRRVPVLVDSRYSLMRFSRFTACTPNESEVEHALGIVIDDRPSELERAGRALLEQLRMEAVLITRGSRGMALFERDKSTLHIPIHGSDQIADVTGAGDTVMATVTLALAAGATFPEAAHLANLAGGVVVMKRGTATVSAAELARAVRG